MNQKPAAVVRIISRSGELFDDRFQAGNLLVRELIGLREEKPVVLGIPRGGIIIAQALARGINAELDIVLSRKLGALGQPELAIGALSESGEVFLNQDIVRIMMIPDSFIEQEKRDQMAEIKRRSQLIRQVLPRTPLKGRTVIVTDDGVATGATMQAAIWTVRHESPRKLVVAIPVASDEAVDKLSRDVDELVCLRLPDYFAAVGQFYRHFEQVTDEQVLEILREEGRRRAHGQDRSVGHRRVPG